MCGTRICVLALLPDCKDVKICSRYRSLLALSMQQTQLALASMCGAATNLICNLFVVHADCKALKAYHA